MGMRHLFLAPCLLCLVMAFPAMAQDCRSSSHLQKLWLELSPAERAHILTGWQRLDETTRPPFPVFRDGAVEKRCRQQQPVDKLNNAPATPLRK